MSVMMFIPAPPPLRGGILVSDDPGLLARVPPDVARDAGVGLYLVERIGASRAVAYLDASREIALDREAWRRAMVVDDVNQIRATAMVARQRAACGAWRGGRR